MKIAIVGWGLEGQSAFKYFGPEHDYLIVSEQPADNFPQRSDKVKLQFLADTQGHGLRGSVKDLSYLDGIDACDKIIYQPTAIFNLQKVFGDNQHFWAKATTAYDIFSENCPSKNIIGVTGTKGKGTTSTLIAKMLQSSGKSIHIGGNIGTPILDLLPYIKSDDWVVWELANFQLKPASYSPHIAVCLMITEEHLDWHPSMQDYLDAKANIFKHQRSEDIAIYFADNKYSTQIARASLGHKIPYFKKPGAFVREDGMIVIGDNETQIIHKGEVKLLGEHNLQNICAAVTTVWQVTQDMNAIKQVLTDFAGLEHRLEFVREIRGVKFFNDSFAATLSAPVAAMEAIKGTKVMIVGGFDRGLELDSLARAFTDYKDDVRKVLIIGAIGQRLAQALDEAGFRNYELIEDNNLNNIVKQSFEVAQPGDSVILSPGAASFDMFKDFEERGLEFKEAVNNL